MAKFVLILIIGIIIVTIISLTIFKVGLQKQSEINAKFILHDSEGPNAGGEFAKELDVNTIPIYLDDWSKLEPADGQWNWGDEFPDNTNEYAHTILRIG